MKIQKFIGDEYQDKSTTDMRREAEFLSENGHPFIIGYVEAFVLPNNSD
jgi:hypothetical protein